MPGGPADAGRRSPAGPGRAGAARLRAALIPTEIVSATWRRAARPAPTCWRRSSGEDVLLLRKSTVRGQADWGRHSRTTGRTAVELELLDFNPIDKLRVRSSRRKVAGEVNRGVVVNLRQARKLLTRVTYVGQRGKNGRRGERLVAFYACLYFAALRPSEALGLRERDCHLSAAVGVC
jgi:integrase